MKYLSIQLFVALFLVSAGSYAAGAKTAMDMPSNPTIEQTLSGAETVAVIDSPASHYNTDNDKSSKKGKGGSKEKKDVQNQTKFLKPDMEAKDFNFYDRKKISSPLMPRYDLDSAVYQKGFKKKEEQQKAFLANKYHYPARPKDQWEIGLHFGHHFLSGDISSDPTLSWGGGISVRKAITYYFSMRLEYTFGIDYQQDYRIHQNAQFDHALNGQTGNANYFKSNNVVTDMFFRNYRLMAHHLDLEGIFNLGNILYHKERTKFNLNLIIGGGGLMYRTQMNMLDKDGKIYNYKPVFDKINQMKAANASESDIKKETLNQLKSIQNGSYTVDAEQPYQGHINVAKYNIIPELVVGAGVDFHATKWMTIGLEERVTIVDNDVMDGSQYFDDAAVKAAGGLTRSSDILLYTSLHFNFNVGKNSVEPLYWLNPMDFTYKKLSDANPDKIAKEILKDTDEDGVPDKLDKEPNSKKGCPVDVKGIALDSDKDGIPDCDDKEPFSPPGYPIDQNGVAQVPPNPCCDNDTTGAGIGGDGAMAGGPGGKGKRNRSGYDCSKVELPGVFFDEDKYFIDPAYQSALHQVAEKLQMCPDVKMVITGVDESKNNQKYNEQLAYNRATSVVDYLVEKYGISRDRFIVKYQGGKKSNANQTPQERKKSRRVEFGYAADGEKGESNPPAPHPGLKAGSNK